MNEADGGLVFRVSGGDGTVGFFALSLSLFFFFPILSFSVLCILFFLYVFSRSIARPWHTPMLRIHLPGGPEM